MGWFFQSAVVRPTSCFWWTRRAVFENIVSKSFVSTSSQLSTKWTSAQILYDVISIKIAILCSTELGRALFYGSMNILQVRVGLATFADSAIERFRLNTYSTKSDLLHAIEIIPYVYGRTATADALRMARETLFTRNCFGNVRYSVVQVKNHVKHRNSYYVLAYTES